MEDMLYPMSSVLPFICMSGLLSQYHECRVQLGTLPGRLRRTASPHVEHNYEFYDELSLYLFLEDVL
jgi:hypothetical protein